MQVGDGFDVQPGVRDHVLHMRAELAAVDHRQFNNAPLERQRRAVLPGLQQALAQPVEVARRLDESEHQVVHAWHRFVNLGPLASLQGQVPDALLRRQVELARRFEQQRRGAEQADAGFRSNTHVGLRCCNQRSR